MQVNHSDQATMVKNIGPYKPMVFCQSTIDAFYGHCCNKAIYTVIIDSLTTTVIGKFMTMQIKFTALPKEEQPSHMSKESGKCINWTIDYIFDHYQLLAVCLTDRLKYFLTICLRNELSTLYLYSADQFIKEFLHIKGLK